MYSLKVSTATCTFTAIGVRSSRELCHQTLLLHSSWHPLGPLHLEAFRKDLYFKLAPLRFASDRSEPRKLARYTTGSGV